MNLQAGCMLLSTFYSGPYAAFITTGMMTALPRQHLTPLTCKYIAHHLPLTLAYLCQETINFGHNI